jgi:hypothetical protein
MPWIWRASGASFMVRVRNTGAGRQHDLDEPEFYELRERLPEKRMHILTDIACKCTCSSVLHVRCLRWSYAKHFLSFNRVCSASYRLRSLQGAPVCAGCIPSRGPGRKSPLLQCSSHHGPFKLQSGASSTQYLPSKHCSFPTYHSSRRCNMDECTLCSAKCFE